MIHYNQPETVGGDVVAKMYSEYNIYKANGEQTLHVVREKKARIGKGWVAMFKRVGIEVIRDLPPAQLRVFLTIMLKQTYEMYVVITVRKMADQLKLSYNRCLEALRGLVAKNIIKRVRFDGVQVFVINPKYTVCGAGTKAQREELWELIERRDSLLEVIGENPEIDIIRKIRQSIESIDKQIQELVENKQFERSMIDDECNGNSDETQDGRGATSEIRQQDGFGQDDQSDQ